MKKLHLQLLSLLFLSHLVVTNNRLQTKTLKLLLQKKLLLLLRLLLKLSPLILQRMLLLTRLLLLLKLLLRRSNSTTRIVKASLYEKSYRLFFVSLPQLSEDSL